MTEMRLVYVTTKNIEEARAIAHELMNRKVVACANILPQMESIYRWEGKLEQASECVLILKTEEAKVDAVIEAVVELHSYDVPCAFSIPIEAGSKAYLDWLSGELK